MKCQSRDGKYSCVRPTDMAGALAGVRRKVSAIARENLGADKHADTKQ